MLTSIASLSFQGHPQPHFHTKAWLHFTTVKWSIEIDVFWSEIAYYIYGVEFNDVTQEDPTLPVDHDSDCSSVT